VDTPAWLLPGDVFNVHRRLVSWSMPGGSGKEADDGAGRRVAHQTTSGVTSTTTYCVGGLEEVDAASGAVTKYYPTPAGTPAALRVGTGAVTYLATDGLGSVSAALDGSGNVTATQLFGPYGQTRYTTGAMPTTKGYTGQRADAASGLDYYNARYYDPATDQFVSADSAGAGLNRYAYVAGNPETATDPTGHRMDCGDACTGGGSGGGTGNGTGSGSSGGSGCTHDSNCGGCYSSCGGTNPSLGCYGTIGAALQGCIQQTSTTSTSTSTSTKSTSSGSSKPTQAQVNNAIGIAHDTGSALEAWAGRLAQLAGVLALIGAAAKNAIYLLIASTLTMVAAEMEALAMEALAMEALAMEALAMEALAMVFYGEAAFDNSFWDSRNAMGAFGAVLAVGIVAVSVLLVAALGAIAVADEGPGDVIVAGLTAGVVLAAPGLLGVAGFSLRKQVSALGYQP
jgi:RHS repeat-associated protein